MANATVNLRFIKSGYVKSVEPYTVIPTDANTLYEVNNGTRYLYFGMEDMPNNLRHNALITAYATVAIKGYGSLHLNTCESDFDPETLTFNNKPERKASPYFEFSMVSLDSLTNKTSTIISQADNVGRLFKNRAFQANANPSGGRYPSIKTVLANGTTLPYVTITYDDAALITSIISIDEALPASINSGDAQDVTWKYQKDTSGGSGYCADETWAQSSATFYWRNKATEQTFHAIQVSGTTTGVTIPAGTFPSGSQIEWYVEGTDEDGTTTETEKSTTVVLPTQITPSNAPTSGYANPRNPISFGWVYQSSTGTAGAGDTSFFWRISGSSSWTEVQATHGANSVTIPANTFQTASTIQWYLSGTDSTGYASETDVYSFSTAAGTVTATAEYPSNTIQSNNQPITFGWNYSSPDGFAPSRFVFKWKLTTDVNWTTLLDETEIVTEYTFPAYTFPSGEIYWVVIPYNIDGVEGTGNSASYICYGAPDAPVVYAENAPFSTVSWQASDQQAYRIKVDEAIYGPYFGTEKRFPIPEKLDDGEHTIGVSVVGTYGLWSEWGEAVINVQNVPGDEIVLGGVGGIDAFLSWVTAEETSDFMVFRDDVQIARTAGITFTDRFATGEHTYKVINRLPNGNYSESNEVTMDMDIDGTYIALLSGGEWLKIKYQLKDASDQEYTESIETVYNHFASDDYPSISISRYRERSLSYSAVFLYVDEEDHARFKDMLRKPVIMKFENGNMIVGVIDSWTALHRKNYYTAYTFSLRRIEWEDYVDDTT